MDKALSPDDFAATLIKLVEGLAPGERRIVAIAGPPGAGKSTLVERWRDRVAAHWPDRPAPAAILPMDGYHFDDELLVPMGRRARKGAPDTFDVGGLRAMIGRLSANAEEDIAVPRFDRELEIARAGARLINQATPLILVEGNYLLLNEAPWTGLADVFDLTVMLKVDEDELARRLRERWVHHGLNEDEILAKLYDNDLPNGRHVYAFSRPADLVVNAGA